MVDSGYCTFSTKASISMSQKMTSQDSQDQASLPLACLSAGSDVLLLPATWHGSGTYPAILAF